MSWEMELNDDTLEELYEWIDSIPLSRQKKRIERDFSDGYCVGEIIRHFLPQYIEMHNLTPAHNLQQKLANWGLLNTKVFNRFGLNLPINISTNIWNFKPCYVVVFLYNLRYKIEERLNENKSGHGSHKGSPRHNSLTNSKLSSKKSPVPTQFRLEYEMKVQECLKQAEEMEILSAKVRRLEHLLELKETRIAELQDRLDKYRPTGMILEKPALLKQNNATANRNRNSVQIHWDDRIL